MNPERVTDRKKERKKNVVSPLSKKIADIKSKEEKTTLEVNAAINSLRSLEENLHGWHIPGHYTNGVPQLDSQSSFVSVLKDTSDDSQLSPFGACPAGGDSGVGDYSPPEASFVSHQTFTSSQHSTMSSNYSQTDNTSPPVLWAASPPPGFPHVTSFTRMDAPPNSQSPSVTLSEPDVAGTPHRPPPPLIPPLIGQCVSHLVHNQSVSTLEPWSSNPSGPGMRSVRTCDSPLSRLTTLHPQTMFSNSAHHTTRYAPLPRSETISSFFSSSQSGEERNSLLARHSHGGHSVRCTSHQCRDNPPCVHKLRLMLCNGDVEPQRGCCSRRTPQWPYPHIPHNSTNCGAREMHHISAHHTSGTTNIPKGFQDQRYSLGSGGSGTEQAAHLGDLWRRVSSDSSLQHLSPMNGMNRPETCVQQEMVLPSGPVWGASMQMRQNHSQHVFGSHLFAIRQCRLPSRPSQSLLSQSTSEDESELHVNPSVAGSVTSGGPLRPTFSLSVFSDDEDEECDPQRVKCSPLAAATNSLDADTMDLSELLIGGTNPEDTFKEIPDSVLQPVTEAASNSNGGRFGYRGPRRISAFVTEAVLAQQQQRQQQQQMNCVSSSEDKEIKSEMNVLLVDGGEICETVINSQPSSTQQDREPLMVFLSELSS